MPVRSAAQGIASALTCPVVGKANSKKSRTAAVLLVLLDTPYGGEAAFIRLILNGLTVSHHF